MHEAWPLEIREQRWNHGCTAQPACGAFGVVHRCVERERVRVRLPPGEGRCIPRAHVRRGIEKAPAGTSAQPFEYAAREKIHVHRVHVHGHDTHGVVGIERHDRTHRVRVRHNARDIDNERRPEQHVRDRHESRALVDHCTEPVGVDAHAVVARHDHHARAQSRCELVIGVAHAREIERRHDDRVARRRVVKRRQHRRLREGDGRRHRHLARTGTEQWRNHIAGTERQVPPSRCPGAHAAGGPLLRVLAEPLRHAARHGAERVGDEVRRAFQNRKLRAESQERIARRVRAGVAIRVGAAHARRISAAAGVGAAHTGCIGATPGVGAAHGGPFADAAGTRRNR